MARRVGRGTEGGKERGYKPPIHSFIHPSLPLNLSKLDLNHREEMGKYSGGFSEIVVDSGSFLGTWEGGGGKGVILYAPGRLWDEGKSWVWADVRFWQGISLLVHQIRK